MTEALSLEEQLMLEWFESPDGHEVLMTSDLAHAKYQELLAKSRKSNTTRTVDQEFWT